MASRSFRRARGRRNPSHGGGRRRGGGWRGWSYGREVADAVFDVDVEDAVGEGVEQLDGVDALGDEVAGVEVDAEGGVVVDGGEGGGKVWMS